VRITVDIDGRPWWAWSVYYMLRGVCRRTEIYKTRRGHHVVGYGAPVRNFEECILVRRALGDDPKRIELDILLYKTGKPFQVLWSVKKGYEVKLLEVSEQG